MVEVKTHPDHPKSMAERISKRLENSGDAKNADVVTKTGDGARRTYHNIFNAGHKIQPGTLPDKDAGR
jgi:hypothetical protein